MSMENELKRIADALERIADAKAATQTTTGTVAVDEGKPVAKRKSTKAVPEVQGVAPEEQVVVAPGPQTGADLMAYCNAKLIAIKDPGLRTATIKKCVTMFKDKYGVTAIRELEDDKIAAAKTDFDALVGGA